MRAAFLALTGLAGLAVAAPAPQAEVVNAKAPTSSLIQTVPAYTLFDPPADYNAPKVLYGRSAELANGTLLSTWENYSPDSDGELVYFPIYQSNDHGATWEHISNVTDQVNDWGLRYQPFLYVMPKAIGKFPAGTILCAGNSIPANLSNTQIDLYASMDSGYTWSFVSHIASGGEALPDNGLTPVWEPFLMIYKNEMIVYYSDQRDPLYGQKLVHQTSKDLLNWAAPVNDVAVAPYASRPGMTTVTQVKNGSYAMTFEYGGAPNGDFAVWYKMSADPTAFGSATAYPIVGTDTYTPTSSPYLDWTPNGGPHGTTVVTCLNDFNVYINMYGMELGTPWIPVNAAPGMPASYTRSTRFFSENQDMMLLVGGGPIGGTSNTVTTAVVNMTEFAQYFSGVFQ